MEYTAVICKRNTIMVITQLRFSLAETAVVIGDSRVKM